MTATMTGAEGRRDNSATIPGPPAVHKRGAGRSAMGCRRQAIMPVP